MAKATSKRCYFSEINVEAAFESLYGYITMDKNFETDTITIWYAMHHLIFKPMKVEREEIRKDSYFLNFIPTGTTTEVVPVLRDAKLRAKEIELIRENYMRFKALEAMRNLGVISEIKFEE